MGGSSRAGPNVGIFVIGLPCRGSRHDARLWLRCPPNLWISGVVTLSGSLDEVVVLGMACHPASDKRAQRAYVEAPVSCVIKRIPRECGADTLTLISLRNDRMEEDDRVGRELVLADTGERVIDARLVVGVHWVVGDCHGHGCSLCQTEASAGSSLVFGARSYAAERGGHPRLLAGGET